MNSLKGEQPVSKKTFEGENITLTDCSEYSLMNLKVKGKTVQDGTPSISNEVEIQNVKGNINIIVSDNNNQQKTVTFPLSENQKLYEGSYLANDGIHHVRGQIDLATTTNAFKSGVSSADIYEITKSYLNLANLKSGSTNVKCSYFNYGNFQPVELGSFNLASSGTSWYFVFAEAGTSTKEQFISWCQEKHPILEYELETEVVEPYTTAQKNAWNTLTKLQMYKGINNIVATSDELSPTVSGTYYTDFKGEKGDTGANGTNATINGKNTLTIETNKHIVMKQTDDKLIFDLDLDLDTILERLSSLESKNSNIEIDGSTISYTPTYNGVFDVYYAELDGTKAHMNNLNYDYICTFGDDEADAVAGTKQTYSKLNTLNIAPYKKIKKIIVVDNIADTIVDVKDVSTQLDFYANVIGNYKYSAGLLSDIHIDGNGDGDNSDTAQSVTDFQYALDFFQNKENVDFVAICGDLTYYGYEADYTKYKEIVANYPNLPIKTLRGNHECYENGETNHNDSNTLYQTNIGPLYYEFVHDNDVFLFLGMDKESSTNPYNSDEIDFLKTKLATYKNQRVFLFTHYYYGETGNINGIAKHSQISDSEGTGKQFIDLMKHYRNVIYFNGHTHLDYKLQEYGANANIQKRTDTMCHRVHISSCSKPRISSTGLAQSAQIDASGSQGCVMDVYQYGIVLRAIDFSYQLYLPIATYWLDTEPIQIADYIEQTDELGEELYYQDTQKTDTSTSSGYSYTFDTDKSVLVNSDSALTGDKQKTSNSFSLSLEQSEKYRLSIKYISGNIEKNGGLINFSIYKTNTKLVGVTLEELANTTIDFTATATETITAQAQIYLFSGAKYTNAKFEINLNKVLQSKNVEMELGTISKSQGTTSSSTTDIRSKNFVEIVGGATYKFSNSASKMMRVHLYDESQTYLSTWFTDTDGSKYGYRNVESGTSITMPSNAKYMKLRIGDTTDTTTVVTITKQ